MLLRRLENPFPPNPSGHAQRAWRSAGTRASGSQARPLHPLEGEGFVARAGLALRHNPAMSDFIIGLTGGVASGKSAVTARFEARGVSVADADVAAREAVAVGSEGLAEVVAAFGAGVLAADGALDRAAMRRRIFDDDGARLRLEAIIHPRVR